MRPAISTVVLGPSTLRIVELVDVASGRARVALDPAPAFRQRLRTGAEILRRLMAEGQTIYGVTTGVGDSCDIAVPPEWASDLPLNLLRFHGCGTGRILNACEAAAVVTARLASLCAGGSGVREVVIERLCELVNRGILPRIPAEGSVGASGDLTPLSYVAATLVGEREVWLDGRVLSAQEALAAAGLEPLALGPKESLALMNGTSFMTGLGCLAWVAARRLARLAAAITAMASDTLRGNPPHFDERIFAAKPHPGLQACARWIRADLEFDSRTPRPPLRIQDRYSLRCAPHVIGVLLDALAGERPIIETELNSANDNPLIDVDSGDVLHGGNFYGGHIAHAMDSLKTAVANLVDLMDRQIALAVNPVTNNGLPANLVARSGPDRVAHHGFKAMHISASALTAEALKLTMPASVFSRSTESHNQDKVSMGAIAARDCQRVLELGETVAAIAVLVFCQAVDLRGGEGCHARSREMHRAVRAQVPVNDADRRQDGDIQRVLELYRSERLPIGEIDFP